MILPLLIFFSRDIEVAAAAAAADFTYAAHIYSRHYDAGADAARVICRFATP